MGVPSRRPEVLHETGNQGTGAKPVRYPRLRVPSGGRLDDLPAPRTSRGGHKLGCLALLALLLVAGAAVWLTRDDATRDAWRKDAVTWLDAKLEGTALAPLMNLLRETPPPPPPSVATPATEPGTLAGPTVQGTVSALVRTDFVSPGAVAPVPAGQEAPKRQYPADSRVQPAFVDDLAGHVLERFQGSGLDLSLPSLNQRYGVKLTGLAGGSRAAVLRYAFHPDMLRSLYTIYADRFLDSLDRQCTERNWSDLQKRQLHMALAGRLNAWAAALDGVAAVPDLSARLAESERLLQESLDIYGRMAGTVFELDEARQRNDAAAIATAQLRVDDITAVTVRPWMPARRPSMLWWATSAVMPVPPWMTTACCSWPSGWAAACSRTARPWPPSAPVPPRCVTWRAVAPGSPAARRLRNSLRPLPSMMFPCGPAPSRPGPVRRQLRHFRLRPAGARLLPRLLRSRLRRSLRKGLAPRPCPRRACRRRDGHASGPRGPANTCGARVRAHACGPAPGNGRRFGRRSRTARTGPVPLGR